MTSNKKLIAKKPLTNLYEMNSIEKAHLAGIFLKLLKRYLPRQFRLLLALVTMFAILQN